MDTNLSQPSQETKVREVVVVGFGRRALAIIVDGIFIFFVSLMIAFILGLTMIVLDWWTSASEWPWRILAWILMLIVSLVYYTGKWAQSSGQTFGKALLGIRIVTTDGSPLTFGRLIMRYIGYIISSLFFSLGFIWVALNKKRRGWHDFIARTYVVSVLHDYPVTGDEKFRASDAGKSWIWVLLWLVLALGTPSGMVGGVWFLGPVVFRILNNLR